MSAPLLEVRGLSKRFGGFTALHAVDMVVGPGERVGGLMSGVDKRSTTCTEPNIRGSG